MWCRHVLQDINAIKCSRGMAALHPQSVMRTIVSTSDSASCARANPLLLSALTWATRRSTGAVLNKRIHITNWQTKQIQHDCSAKQVPNLEHSCMLLDYGLDRIWPAEA